MILDLVLRFLISYWVPFIYNYMHGIFFRHFVYNATNFEIHYVVMPLLTAVVDFYKNLGFEADPEGIKGMFWYPRY